MNMNANTNNVQCVFCGSHNDITDIKGKPVCKKCLEELLHITAEMETSS